ncbi:17716_t:CDS:2, partial [Cetraspora pellucida]
MPCYLDTIIRIKYVKQNETKDAKSISVWAIGTYPVGREDNEIEVILYVPRDPVERDPESQAIFRRDEYYSVGGKIMSVATSTHLTIVDKNSESNKCPLKVSLVGIPQEKPTTIESTDNSIIETLITDHIGQTHDYTICIVYPHTNPRFEHLKTTIQPLESVIFVVGQMEIIDNKIYVNAKDINYIYVKKNNSETDSLQIQSTPTNSTRSKLLHIHQNITKNSKDIPTIQTPPLTTSSDIESGPSVKRRRSEEIDPFTDAEPAVTTEINSVDHDQEELEKPIKKNKSKQTSTQNQIKNKQQELKNIIKESPLNKAPGPQAISNEMLKHLSLSAKQSLLWIFNTSLALETIPKQWKKATIYSISKKPTFTEQLDHT